MKVCGPNLAQMSLESEFGTEFGTRVWSLGQSLRPESEVWVRSGSESGVWVRVWVRVLRQSLESGQSLGQNVWSLGQSLGHRVWGQSLESGSEFGLDSGPEFG